MGVADEKTKEPNHKQKDKHKHKHKHKEKRKREDLEEDHRLRKEAKKLLKKEAKAAAKTAELVARDPPVGTRPASAPVLTPDDYFTHNRPFSLYLFEYAGKSFVELQANEARAYFKSFISAWNDGLLSLKYYDRAADQAGLAVRNRTPWVGGSAEEALSAGGAMNRVVRRAEEKRHVQEEREWIDSTMPKATGREAKVEACAMRRQEKQAREASPDLVHLPGGGDVFGAGDADSIVAARARQRQQDLARDRRRQAAHPSGTGFVQRAAAAAESEKEKMAALRRLLPQGGAGFSIAKRL